MHRINEILKREYDRWHDYYYLRWLLSYVKKTRIDTVIAGSSYTRFGIDDELIPSGWCNVSLPSQDLYYGIKLAKQVYNSNKDSLKQVVIGLGYYGLYWDVSLSKNLYSREIIRDVYYKILYDSHNTEEIIHNISSNCFKRIIRYLVELVLKVMLDIQGFFMRCNPQKKTVWNGVYFGKSFSRDYRRLAYWNKKEKRWNELTDNERQDAAYLRANEHNRLIKYIGTRAENVNLLNDFYIWCNEKKITVKFIITPYTAEYNGHILFEEYGKELFNIVTKIFGSDSIIDLNTNKELNFCFTKDNFVDMDHLNDNGAKIISNYLVKKFIT